MANRVERLLWWVALVALGIFAFSVAERQMYQAYLDWQFAAMLDPPAPDTRPPGLPAAADTSGEGQVLGRLEIPSIGLSAMVAEGVEAATLRRGVGHVPGTALPGGTGNVGLSAHRDSFFRHLGDLRRNDPISITTLAGTFEYLVETTSIVDPDESAVLRDVGRPTLTLVTCYPFYYVGAAPKRFIVHAGLVAY
jgi:sortase A